MATFNEGGTFKTTIPFPDGIAITIDDILNESTEKLNASGVTIKRQMRTPKNKGGKIKI